MGQKVDPIGLRLGINKDWEAKWYASKNDFAKVLANDLKIREYIKKNLKNLNKSEDSLDMMQDVLDLQSMKMLMKNNEHIYFAGNRWCIELESFGEVNKIRHFCSKCYDFF